MLQSTNTTIESVRTDFLANHRPKVRIKHLWLAEDIWGGQQIRVNLGIVNNGTVEATLNTMGINSLPVTDVQFHLIQTFPTSPE